MISEKANYHCLQTGLARALPVSPSKPEGLSPLRASSSPHRLRCASVVFFLFNFNFLLIDWGPCSELGHPASRSTPRCWKSFSLLATLLTSGWRLRLCLPSPPLSASTTGTAAPGLLEQAGGLCSSGSFPPSFPLLLPLLHLLPRLPHPPPGRCLHAGCGQSRSAAPQPSIISPQQQLCIFAKNVKNIRR